MTTPTPSPRTAEGRALHDKTHGTIHGHIADADCYLLTAILAIEAQAAQPDTLLREAGERVLRQFDHWASAPRPADGGGTVRLYNFREVQPSMEAALDAFRAALAAPAEQKP